ncbi:MAG: RNA 2',3'-cyclic phosphodiesterase [Acidimicrobiales bacterium]
MRLFIAVWPPDEVLDLVGALPRPKVVGARWTTRDQWHVTLRFLGEVDEGQLPDVVAVLAGLGLRSVDVTLGPAVERLNPRIVSVSVLGLEEIGPAVVGATRSFGKPPEDRPFRGHLTLARLRGVRKWELAEALGAPISAAWRVDVLHVVRSRLSPHGARYDTVERVALS